MQAPRSRAAINLLIDDCIRKSSGFTTSMRFFRTTSFPAPSKMERSVKVLERNNVCSIKSSRCRTERTGYTVWILSRMENWETMKVFISSRAVLAIWLACSRAFWRWVFSSWVMVIAVTVRSGTNPMRTKRAMSFTRNGIRVGIEKTLHHKVYSESFCFVPRGMHKNRFSREAIFAGAAIDKSGALLPDDLIGDVQERLRYGNSQLVCHRDVYGEEVPVRIFYRNVRGLRAFYDFIDDVGALPADAQDVEVVDKDGTRAGRFRKPDQRR